MTNTTPLVIEKYLDINTGHIPYEDMLALRELAVDCAARLENLIVYEKDEYGLWVYCGHEEDFPWEMPDWGLSDALKHILELANQAGCAFVLFDSDGTEYSQLPKFEW